MSPAQQPTNQQLFFFFWICALQTSVHARPSRDTRARSKMDLSMRLSVDPVAGHRRTTTDSTPTGLRIIARGALASRSRGGWRAPPHSCHSPGSFAASVVRHFFSSPAERARFCAAAPARPHTGRGARTGVGSGEVGGEGAGRGERACRVRVAPGRSARGPSGDVKWGVGGVRARAAPRAFFGGGAAVFGAGTGRPVRTRGRVLG